MRSPGVSSRLKVRQICLIAWVGLREVLTSHSRTVPSNLEVARVRPSGLKASEYVSREGSVRLVRSLPVSVSHK